MPNYHLNVNGAEHVVEVAADTPLLWVLREKLGLTGTKFSCGIGQCGACLVHINGEAVNSCTLPVAQVAGKSVLTIEGLSATGDHPVQQAWIAEQVPQCGYCQSGQIMAAAALLRDTPHPTEQQIEAAMDRVLCRCGTYQRIKRAIRAAEKSGSRKQAP